MNAEQNDWSVTIYADNPQDILVLRALCERARKVGVSFGSVGIFPKTSECGPDSEGLIRFVCFQHSTWSSLKELIFQDGMPSDLRPKRVRVEWKDDLKLHSKGNRKARLHQGV